MPHVPRSIPLLLAALLALPAGCSRNRSSSGGGGGSPAVPVLGIAPDSVAMLTGKSRDLVVYLSGTPYTGDVLWSVEGGELLPLPAEARARYTGSGLQGVFEVRAELPDLGISFASSIFLATHRYTNELPFVVPGGEDSAPIATAALDGNWAAFGEASADGGTRVRLVDLVTGQVRSSPPLEADHGAPLGIELVDGDPVVLFAPEPWTNLYSLIRFDASLLPAELIAEFPSAVVPALARDRTGALLLSRSPPGPGGVGAGTEIVRIELDPAGGAVEEALFAIGGPEIHDLAADASDLLYLVTAGAVRRFELDGSPLDPGAPFRAALGGSFTRIALDAEGGVLLAGTDEVGLRIFGETGHEVHAVREFGGEFGFVRGDANGDGVVDLLDLDAFIDHLLGGPVPCRKALDVNADRRVDVRDYIALNEHLSFGNIPPAAPFPDCGSDPDPESPISCVSGTCEGVRQFAAILALAADPFGDPNASSRFVAVDDWVSEASAAVAVVFDPVDGVPPDEAAPPTDLRYPLVEAFILGEPARPLHPIASGGTPTLFAISPALPAGLSIDAATGVISGTPLQISPPARYTVTARNAGGTAATDLELAVGL